MLVAKVTDEGRFRELVSVHGGKMVVVKFGASWCTPCNELQSVFESLATDLHKNGYGAELVEVDRDDMEDVFEEYGILKMPTFKTFFNGVVTNTIQTPNKEQLRSQVHASLPTPSLALDVDF